MERNKRRLKEGPGNVDLVDDPGLDDVPTAFDDMSIFDL